MVLFLVECEHDWRLQNGLCLLFVSTKRNFTESKAFCREHNAHLVTILNVDEMDRLTDMWTRDFNATAASSIW